MSAEISCVIDNTDASELLALAIVPVASCRSMPLLSIGGGGSALVGAARNGGSCLGKGFCGGSCRVAGEGESVRPRTDPARGGEALLPPGPSLDGGVNVLLGAGFGGVSVIDVGMEENNDSVQDERSS